jgi:predicted metal-dependent hydrolase
MTLPRIALEENPDFRKGLELFNKAHFFDAHEALEDVWRLVPPDHSSKSHFQGMVQVAVAFHHQSTGNLVGARSVLARALRNLRGGEATFPHIDLTRLREESQQWVDYLALASATGCANQPSDEGGTTPLDPPPLPRIIFVLGFESTL